MPFLRKYNTLTVTGTTAIRVPIIKRGLVDFAVGADWTPAAGDVKILVDGTAAANVTNLPTAVATGNGAVWEFVLTAAELSCKQAHITIVDAATKAIEDQSFIVETFGNASAMYQMDLSDSVRLGLTSLPNAAAGANGGLPTGDASGRVDVGKWLGTAASTPTVAGVPNVNAKTWNDLPTVELPLVPATAGRKLVVDAAGLADANVVKVGPTGSGTAQTARDIGLSVIAASVTARVTANADQLAGQTVTAAAGVTFPTSVASPTNITAASGVALTTAYDPAKTASQAGDAMALTASERTTLAAVIWNALTSGLTTVASIGKLLVTNIDAAMSSRSTYAGGDTSGTTTLLSRIASALTITGGKVDVNDKTGFSLTTGYDLAKTAAQAGDAMTLTAGERANSALAVWVSGTRTLSSFGTLIADIWAAVADSAGVTTLLSRLTQPRATNLDNLDAAVSTRLATSGYTTPPTAAQNADKLLGRNIAGGLDGGRTVKDCKRLERNKVTLIGGTLTVYEEDDVTVAWTATVTTDASADPVVGVDPA